MTGISNIGGSKTRPGAIAIGERLREMFDSLASSPMPEHLVALVDQLETAWRADRSQPDESAMAPTRPSSPG